MILVVIVVEYTGCCSCSRCRCKYRCKYRCKCRCMRGTALLILVLTAVKGCGPRAERGEMREGGVDVNVVVT